MTTSPNGLRALVQDQLGKLAKGTKYVWADTNADNFVTKILSSVLKKEYILVLEKEKLHILTLDTKKNSNDITESLSYDIGDLDRISITNVGSFDKPMAKIIAFKAPTGEKHSYRISYDTRGRDHKQQKEHLLDIVDLLMPSE